MPTTTTITGPYNSRTDHGNKVMNAAGVNKILRYPLNIGESTSPAIMFNISEALYNNHGSVATDLNQHIALYVVPGVSFNDNIQYEDRSSGMAGSFKGAAVNVDEIKKAATAFGSSAAGKALLVGVGASAAAKATALLPDKAKQTVGTMIPAGLGGAIGNVASGYVDEQSKKHQSVLKENPFITFKGVGLREWSFSWSFIPESKEESDSVKQIIYTFRKSMYPKNEDWTLKFPEVFSIEFVNAEFPKMPEVALQSCNVVYNKDSNSFFKENDEPVRVDMTLNFRELMPIYRSHIEMGY
jgi:hypothetical protein